MINKKNVWGGYVGSTIAQDIAEGDENFHGYLLWDIKSKNVEEIPIFNENTFKNIKINQYIDFDDLDFEIDNPTKYMKIRFIWGTLPQTRTKENERKLSEYIKNKYQNHTISHKNEFIEADKIDIQENITLDNINKKSVQHEIFKEYLLKIGTDEKIINDIIALDEEVLNNVDIIEDFGIEWNVIKFGCKNFMSYGEFDIDWRDNDGLYQITGKNQVGKTTILKALSYLFYGKTLETETRQKFGDSRFINNRNGADFCSGYVVIEANGEYFGIKRRTEIVKAKDGSINGAPTTLNYYILNSPDDEMNENCSLEKLDDNNRVETQKKLESIIGSYDNFIRLVITTSDTLNKILSNDMAVFIDSLLFDSGLDIFDKKLAGFKLYEKKVNTKNRVNCDVIKSTNQNEQLIQEIKIIVNEINDTETIKLPNIQNNINKGKEYVERLTKKLFKIDPEIYDLSIDNTKESISTHENNIIEYNARETILIENMLSLKETYDVNRLNALLEKKDIHKQNEYNLNIKIREIKQTIANDEHAIEIINGDIFRLKNTGTQHKNNIKILKESKICPTCGQVLGIEHQTHIDDNIKTLEKEMFITANQIKTKETIDKQSYHTNITNNQIEITNIEKEKIKLSLELENELKEIGILTNEKNDVEKRKELQIELNQIPIKIENEKLNKNILEQKLLNYENNLKEIEENKKIELGIIKANERLIILENERDENKENIIIKKSNVVEKQKQIKTNESLIDEFKSQEYRDMIMDLYRKCVHRDGIPRQMLTNYVLPKINLTLENILSTAPFKVWLDTNDLRLKLVQNNRPLSIIDCISASGKERTFSSVVLKFALNQINVKSKPTIFLLDEIMGKLVDESIEEFNDILQLIKNNTKKVLIIEHNSEVNPDYLINVELDNNGISSITIE